jgi:hypothetical protein
MVKIWVITQLLTLRSQVEMGLVLEVVGKAKIRQLEEFYDFFSLDDISLEDVESSESTLSHIVSHKLKLTLHDKIEAVLNGD